MYLMIENLKSLLRRDEGQDLLEYALLVALIAVVCIGAITAAGGAASAKFTEIANAI